MRTRNTIIKNKTATSTQSGVTTPNGTQHMSIRNDGLEDVLITFSINSTQFWTLKPSQVFPTIEITSGSRVFIKTTNANSSDLQFLFWE